MTPHVDSAHAYVRDVLKGTIPACAWVQRACRRHRSDLARARRKDFPYRFDAARAEAACAFAELLPHVKGHWAIPTPGKPNRIHLEPFQCFERAMLFGWVEKGTGLRRFRVAYIERPRKNAKSTDAAITGLYCLAADQEFGAEVYSGATSEKQAWEVFRPAKQMAERTPAFRESFGVTVNAKSLVILETGSRFEPIIGKPGDGASPSLSITDEYHEHMDSTQFDTMVTGMGARRQPLALVITTAGDNLDSPCYALHERAQKMLNGTLPDDRLFAIIYTIDEGDDWTTDAALRKANPNYDVSVSGEFLREQQRKAITDSREQNVFKTKHLNIWCTVRSPWVNMEWWHRQADPSLRIEGFLGERCWDGYDLASRLDLVSRARIFTRLVEGQAHYYYFGRHYVPEAAIADPTKKHYQGWAHDGHLIATDGNDCDLPTIVGDAQFDKLRYRIVGAGIDPWNSIGLRDGLVAASIPAVEIPQQVAHFSETMKTIEAALKDGRFHHDGNPCMTWMIGNVTVRPDAKDNIFPRKERAENKIDGPVAMIMAMKLALTSAKPSVYESRGLLEVTV
jgi:phage terminase large subunit-like protein